MKQFFEKFPQYRNSSVFVTGESYAGMYVPTLASRIIDGQKEFPVKLEGIAIGNGLLNVDLNDRSSIEFWYGHGFVDEDAFRSLDKCCKGDIATCDFDNECRKYKEINVPARRSLNAYDIYRDCSMPTPLSYSRREPYERSAPMLAGIVPKCSPYLEPYLNKPEARQALHVSEHVGRWQMCKLTIRIAYKRSEVMSPLIRKVVDSNARVLLYYGDTDAVCNFLGGQKFANALGLKKKDSEPAWIFDGILGGSKTEYDKNLTFNTVRGVGHMVPQWQPAGAEYFMRHFLKNQPI